MAGAAKGAARAKRKAGRWSKAATNRFLAELAQTANVTRAAEAAGVHVSVVYKRRKSEPGFAIAWDEALCAGYERLELLMLERAIADMADTPLPDGAAKPLRMSERTMLTLLAQHRQTVRDLRAAADRTRGEAGEGDDTLRARLIETLEEMHDRLMAADDS